MCKPMVHVLKFLKANFYLLFVFNRILMFLFLFSNFVFVRLDHVIVVFLHSCTDILSVLLFQLDLSYQCIYLFVFQAVLGTNRFLNQD